MTLIEEWHTDLNNSTTQRYQNLAKDVTDTVSNIYKQLSARQSFVGNKLRIRTSPTISKLDS